MSMALLMALAQEGFEQCKSTYAGRGTGEATSAMGRISDAWVALSPIDWVLAPHRCCAGQFSFLASLRMTLLKMAVLGCVF
jgi:hypothetical protein